MSITRTIDFLSHQLNNFPKQDCLAAKVNGQWVKYSTQDVQKMSDFVSLGLLKLGIGKNDKVAIISFNRPEWVFADYGIQQIGAISVPMYPTITVEDYRYIFNDAEVKAIFVADSELYNKVVAATDGLDSVKEIYTFDEVHGAKHWSEVVEMGKQLENPEQLNELRDAVTADDILTIIYTSGTTGNPKGVMLTHNNIVSNVQGIVNYVPVNNTHRALSFLPLCHIFERMLMYMYLRIGVSIYYAESIEKVADNLKEVQPHIFTTVPRLLEKVYDKIVAKGMELTGVKRKLFFWALELGLKYDTQKDNGWWYNQQLALANKLIFSKWREALGGNVIAIVSGGAALQPRLARVFWAANIRVMEGYGLTETSPVITFNRFEPENNMIGTVGLNIDNVEVKIAEADGEILTRGPHVMKGYYNKPELTAEVIDSDGWFHTGDIGEMVHGKYLKITDRKKEMFKTSGGKYVAPQPIENKLKESVVIEQVMVVGDGQKYAAALIVPSFMGLQDYCMHKGIPYTTDADMITKPEIVEKFKREIEKANHGLAQYETVKKFKLIPNMWTVESGELTPTLKVKRKIISANYKKEIDSMF
ncbi:long-chain fatty acid--CoA ligase [Pontibacter sp. BT310]|uniref:Long-chain fatty acid--CoA ligase n=1 Tax=Pontibacter populi TaxID=890055 RepID=A0ABS6XGM6_9BACT|nr:MULTISPECIES: long-chain fatty acid--CoA ligase [Pontibacter]MBJ6119870.1 long-chain fatty acid--CoA ligase [Pontibacter sp. BT310]MBR0572299.1 long-chain fatty acid--CoA ligase [Microvirga sp. STS03]MBW3366723.1 long-chain fatty acid--CoA ligase [Pontibacter populi]